RPELRFAGTHHRPIGLAAPEHDLSARPADQALPSLQPLFYVRELLAHVSDPRLLCVKREPLRLRTPQRVGEDAIPWLYGGRRRELGPIADFATDHVEAVALAATAQRDVGPLA